MPALLLLDRFVLRHWAPRGGLRGGLHGGDGDGIAPAAPAARVVVAPPLPLPPVAAAAAFSAPPSVAAAAVVAAAVEVPRLAATRSRANLRRLVPPDSPRSFEKFEPPAVWTVAAVVQGRSFGHARRGEEGVPHS